MVDVVEITSKALAAVLSASAAAPEDLEGLLFGRLGRRKCAAVEGFLLVGPSWSICNVDCEVSNEARSLIERKGHQGQQLLGWCSLRRSLPSPQRPSDRMPTVRERCVHEAVSCLTEDVAAVGCVFLRGSDPNQLGCFVIDSICFLGASCLPVEMRVRSMGATTGESRCACLEDRLMKEVLTGVEEPLIQASHAIESAVDRGLAQLGPDQLVGPGVQLHRHQRESFNLDCRLEAPSASLAQSTTRSLTSLTQRDESQCEILPRYLKRHRGS